MGNCLVTRLKGVVNNDDLITLNGLSLKPRVDYVIGITGQGFGNVHGKAKLFGNGDFIRYNSSNPSDYTIIGKEVDDIFWKGVEGYDENTRVVVELSGVTAFPIPINYNRGDPNVPSFDFLGKYEENLFYYFSQTLVTVFDVNSGDYPGYKPSLKEIGKCSKLTFLRLSSYKNGGGILDSCIDDLKGLVNLVTLDFVNGYYFYGHISTFGYMLSLTDAVVSNCPIEGAVEDIVTIRRASGQSTGSINFTWLGSEHVVGKIPCGDVTFNGVKVPSTEHLTLSWTADSITLGDTTISA